jgi:hypothetical protein
MESIFKNFLSDNQDCKELLGEFKYKRDKVSFDVLLNRFNDYLFKMYAVSYIKKTIQRDAVHIKQRILNQIKRNNEELTLNNDSDEFPEGNISNIKDTSIDFVESISVQSVNKTKLRALSHLKAVWRCKHGLHN